MLVLPIWGLVLLLCVSIVVMIALGYASYWIFGKCNLNYRSSRNNDFYVQSNWFVSSVRCLWFLAPVLLILMLIMLNIWAFIGSV